MSMFVDSTSGAIEHCETMAKLHPDLADKYGTLQRYTTDKLWHQLTEQVLEFVSNESNLRTTVEGTNSFLALFDKVVLSVDKKLNQLALARIASAVAASLTDGTAAKAILENLLEKKDQLGPAAALYVESKLSLLQLRLLESGNREANDDILPKIKTMLKKNAATLSEMLETDASQLVHAAHYECSMTYYKAVGPPEAYYREALQYLHYISLEELDKEKRFQLATDLSLAALTGDGVFNFGEIVTTPILQELRGTPLQWLVSLLEAASQGNVVEFSSILQQHQAEIAKQPALVNRAHVLEEKITLLALVNMVFERPASERTLTFDEIARRIHNQQVELVVMRALSLHLMEGSMDQVDQTLQVTWVMPRVLDTAQLSQLANRFGEWAIKTAKTNEYMGEQTPMLSMA